MNELLSDKLYLKSCNEAKTGQNIIPSKL